MASQGEGRRPVIAKHIGLGCIIFFSEHDKMDLLKCHQAGGACSHNCVLHLDGYRHPVVVIGLNTTKSPAGEDTINVTFVQVIPEKAPQYSREG